jgi:hypothetical protein
MWNPQGNYFIVKRLTFLFLLLSITGNTKASAGSLVRAFIDEPKDSGKIRNSTLSRTTQTLFPFLFLYSHTRAVALFMILNSILSYNPLSFPNTVVT